ncbi:MAG: hypothetical protein HQL50_12085 [Magnetococcales bacterium]|nr:hypothetical protein [Magnetococcales bacterium]
MVGLQLQRILMVMMVVVVIVVVMIVFMIIMVMVIVMVVIIVVVVIIIVVIVITVMVMMVMIVVVIIPELRNTGAQSDQAEEDQCKGNQAAQHLDDGPPPHRHAPQAQGQRHQTDNDVEHQKPFPLPPKQT